MSLSVLTRSSERAPLTTPNCDSLRQGIAFVLIAGSAVGGNPVAGRLISGAKGDFLDAILFSGTTVVVGACLVIAGRMVFAKEKGTWRV